MPSSQVKRMHHSVKQAKRLVAWETRKTLPFLSKEACSGPLILHQTVVRKPGKDTSSSPPIMTAPMRHYHVIKFACMGVGVGRSVCSF
jgi:hypothetical protein